MSEVLNFYLANSWDFGTIIDNITIIALGPKEDWIICVSKRLEKKKKKILFALSLSDSNDFINK